MNERIGHPHLLVSVSLLLTLVVSVGCGAQREVAAPTMDALPIEQAVAPEVPLTENHFRSDRTSNLSEAQLKEILDAPVLLEDAARVGIVPVATAYDVDDSVPVNAVPHRLSEAMERTGLFDIATEVATDWPADGSVAGLRELAARYRVKYLLLYRHRFVDKEHTNSWAWAWATGVGLFVAPSQTLDTAGVMEASLFDVRTGTILFTVFHRLEGSADENIWRHDDKLRALKRELLAQGTTDLTKLMIGKVRRLAALTYDAGKVMGARRAKSQPDTVSGRVIASDPRLAAE